MAAALVAPDKDLSSRMHFITDDAGAIAAEKLSRYGVIFLAALVGVDREQKAAVVEHLARSMAPGAMLVVRSAHGARMFLYPVVEPADLKGFEVLSVYHPNDEVINSVVIARKPAPQHAGHGGSGGGGCGAVGAVIANCKCCEWTAMKNGHGGVMVEEMELPSGI
ncbi:Nicotianamine synthase [Apostasia shenzhenica]|uniref:Nicotianamine synthase n=1 Tax=Apostasia shenzhenica TaxID=1088818 RepID=A0A2I0AGP6_9ASPA|nr:Nicotianamine synthase [Apostasia shenzhenica]